MADESNASNEPLLRISERLAQLRAGREGSLGMLQAELMRERALSHARAVEKVDRAFVAMHEALGALDAAEADPARAGERPALLAAFDVARAATLHARWELEVQRDAMGFVSQSTLDEDWPVPPRRK